MIHYISFFIILLLILFLLKKYYIDVKLKDRLKEPFHNLHRSKVEQHYRFTMDDYPYGWATHPPTDYAIRREKLRNEIQEKYNLYVKQNPFDKKALVQYKCRPTITNEYTDCGPYARNICTIP
jgi:hypothetical protein